MCDKCNNTNNWKFCPYCGNELPNEDNTVVTQETFDAIFLDMLRKANKVVWLTDDGKKTDIPTCRFALFNTDNEWMFTINLNKKTPEFWCSIARVLKVFTEQYGLKGVDIQRLMKNQLKLLFNMDEVTPLVCRLRYSY